MFRFFARLFCGLLLFPFTLFRFLFGIRPDPVQVAEEAIVDRDLDAVDAQAEYLAAQIAEEERRLEIERRHALIRGRLLAQITDDDEPEPEHDEAAVHDEFDGFDDFPQLEHAN